MTRSRTSKGVPLDNTVIHTLAYADDAALPDDGDHDGISRGTERVTSIASGSRAEADMDISIIKTKVLHVRAQSRRSPAQEAVNAYKFTSIAASNSTLEEECLCMRDDASGKTSLRSTVSWAKYTAGSTKLDGSRPRLVDTQVKLACILKQSETLK